MKKKLPGGKKGFVLVLALVTMLAMTIIGLSVVMNMTTDMALSRNERDAKVAFQLAEAGIHEAIARLHLPVNSARYIGEVFGEPDYRTINWNSGGEDNFSPGNADVNRRSADSLNYSVTIRYLDETNPERFCDANDVGPNSSDTTSPNFVDFTSTDCVNATPELVMYGKDFKMGSLTHTSYGRQPVYRITSTGTSNGTTRVIEAYVGASNLNTDSEAGINTNQTITWNGGNCTASVVPAGSCRQGQSNVYETYLGEDITAVRDMADEVHRCSTGTCNGAGDDIPANGGLEDVVQSWGDFAGDSFSTLIYIENAAPGRGVSMNNLVGRGILVVTGDLDLAGNVHYEGLIYVLGTLRLSGGGSAEKQVTGGIMARNVVEVNGSNLTVTYDQPTLEAVSKENSKSTFILWKRL